MQAFFEKLIEFYNPAIPPPEQAVSASCLKASGASNELLEIKTDAEEQLRKQEQNDGMQPSGCPHAG